MKETTGSRIISSELKCVKMFPRSRKVYKHDTGAGGTEQHERQQEAERADCPTITSPSFYNHQPPVQMSNIGV